VVPKRSVATAQPTKPGGKDRGLFGGERKGEGKEREDAASRASVDKEIANEVEQLEKDMNELKATYELYFMGVEKVEPRPQRDLMKSTLRRWQEAKPKNTGLKFKIQQLKARMVSLENYWERISRQKEAGTYKRDVIKAKRRDAEMEAKQLAAEKKQAGVGPQGALTKDLRAGAIGEGQALTGAALQAGKSGADTAGRPAAQGQPDPGMARPRAASADDLTEPKLRKLYQTYVNARKRCGEAVDLRYEDMAAALRKQVPKLMKETGAKSVEFKVVIRSGRAVLKALPKE
jgi:hypothetical protein